MNNEKMCSMGGIQYYEILVATDFDDDFLSDKIYNVFTHDGLLQFTVVDEEDGEYYVTIPLSRIRIYTLTPCKED